MSKNKKSIKYMVELALLIAIIVLMAFTPIGFLRIGIFSITLLSIPVAVGAIHMGPKAGLILGLAFGLTSFSQAFGMDALGTTLMAINPVGLFIVTVGTRTLMGLLTGLFYLLLEKLHCNRRVATFLGALSAPVLNTILYMFTFVAIFKNYCVENFGMQAVLPFITAMVGVNGIVEAIVGCMAGGAIVLALRAAMKSN